MPTRPTLYLTGPREGLPTLDDVIALARALTGREPTQAEIDEARKIYREICRGEMRDSR